MQLHGHGARAMFAATVVIPHCVGDSSLVQLCRRTISLIQIGANGEVQPLETASRRVGRRASGRGYVGLRSPVSLRSPLCRLILFPGFRLRQFFRPLERFSYQSFQDRQIHIVQPLDV